MASAKASAKTKVRDIQKLVDTRGWKLIDEVMAEEMQRAAMMIAEQKQMSLDDINFMRGAIWAAAQLRDMPARLIQKFETELRLDDKTPPTGE